VSSRVSVPLVTEAKDLNVYSNRPSSDSRQRLLDLRRNFQRKRIHPLRQVANISQKLVVENYRWNRGKEPRRRRHKRFRNTRRNSAQGSRPCAAEPGKRVNNSPNRPKQSDERCHRARRRKPRHSFFHAPPFFRRCKLHAHRPRLQALQSWRGFPRARTHLALQFPKAGGVDVRKRRSRLRKRLRIRHAFRRAKNSQKLVALPLNPPKDAQFLQNHRPGNQREKKQKREYSAGYPARLFKNIQ